MTEDEYQMDRLVRYARWLALYGHYRMIHRWKK